MLEKVWVTEMDLGSQLVWETELALGLQLVWEMVWEMGLGKAMELHPLRKARIAGCRSCCKGRQRHSFRCPKSFYSRLRGK